MLWNMPTKLGNGNPLRQSKLLVFLMESNGVASRKRKRLKDAEKQRQYRKRNLGKDEVQKKERERKRKSYHESKVEKTILQNELASAREENQQLRRKVQNLKVRLASAEIQCEAIDVINLATSPPTEDAQQENEFCKKLKADPKIFKTLLGVTQSDFHSLLGEVSDAYKMTTMSGKLRKCARAKEELLPLETVLIMTLFWL